jgi:hypothetical protein
VCGQCHAPGNLPPGKTQYALYSRLSCPQGWSVWVRKILPPLGFNPPTVRPVASRYTIYTIPALHRIDTRKKVQLHRPIANSASYHRGVHYASIRTFNKLPAFTAELLKDKKHFILALKRFLIVKSLYSMNEYLYYQQKRNIEFSLVVHCVSFLIYGTSRDFFTYHVFITLCLLSYPDATW